jgi:ABC-type polysaccharide/polyol phosphate export permease
MKMKRALNPYWVFMALSALGISLIGSGVVKIIEDGEKLIFIGFCFLITAILYRTKLYKIIKL